jgi:hypothetical protein
MRSRHLNDEEAARFVFNEACPADVVAHYERCDRCRERVATARESWRLVSEVDVPEPSPLFWEAQRRRISRSIDAAAAHSWTWRWVTAAAAATALVAAVLIPRLSVTPEKPQSIITIPAWSPLPPAEEDEILPIIEQAIQEGDAGWNGCHLGNCVVDLSEDESRAVADLLRREMGRNL